MTADLTGATRLRGLAATGRPSLARAELLRIRSRRFVRLLVALGFVVMLGAVIIAFVNSAKPSPEAEAAARATRDALVAECRSFQPELTPEQLDQACDPENFGPLEQFYPKLPFGTSSVQNGALGVAGGFAALLFLVGVTSGGADWAAKTMPALLFWEPRRSRVLLTKLAVVAGVAAAVAALAQAVWVGLASALVSARGDWSARPDRFWPDLLAQQGRGVLLGVLAACAGFALAMLVRNTGAALGLAFVYLAVLENALRGFLPSTRPFLLADNIGGLMTPGGVDVVTSKDRYLDEVGGVTEVTQAIVHLSNQRSGLTLLAGLAIAVGLALVTFRRRDLT